MSGAAGISTRIIPHQLRHYATEMLRARVHTLEMFRRTQPDGSLRHYLDRIANRLCKILSQIRKLPTEK